MKLIADDLAWLGRKTGGTAGPRHTLSVHWEFEKRLQSNIIRERL